MMVRVAKSNGWHEVEGKPLIGPSFDSEKIQFYLTPHQLGWSVTDSISGHSIAAGAEKVDALRGARSNIQEWGIENVATLARLTLANFDAVLRGEREPYEEVYYPLFMWDEIKELKRSGQPLPPKWYSAENNRRDLQRVPSIYVIKVKGLYKIGLSQNPTQRINSMQLPERPEVIFIHETKDAKKLERSLHDKYRKCREHGEWFSLSQDQVDEIKRICIGLLPR